jgi:hypothetical protein
MYVYDQGLTRNRLKPTASFIIKVQPCVLTSFKEKRDHLGVVWDGKTRRRRKLGDQHTVN